MITAASCTVKEEKVSTPLEFSDSIRLVTPEKVGGASINEALWNRKSHREYTNVPLPLEELSGVLWAAAGYAENVNLYSAAHGLKSITRGSAKSEEIITLLNLDPTRYTFILAQSVGK